jgi:sec-independent protein translocase protein TatA
MGRLGVTEILVILAIVLLLLVVKNPELMKGLGSGIKEFKTKDGQPADKKKRKIKKGFS